MTESANTPPNPPPPPTANDAAKAAAQTAAPPSEKTAETFKPGAGDKDPMRELLDRMEQLHTLVAGADPGLARTMRSLNQQGGDPDRRSQPGFRTEVAYALQDLKKFHTSRIEIPPRLRAEMAHLAGTAPGLENERMQALLRATASIEDRGLIRDIRVAAGDLGRRAEQSSPMLDSLIDAIENKVRLTRRGPDLAQPAEAANGQVHAQPTTASQQRVPPARQATADAAIDADAVPNGRRYDAPATGDPRPRNVGQNQGPVTVQHSVLDTILRAMRPDSNQASPPWEPPPTPMHERIAREEAKTRANFEEHSFQGAEQSGKAALQALLAFSNGEAAAIMNRIQEAAKTEPGGLPQVLSEMREGGRFSDLRNQFGNALADDQVVTASYDKAAAALAAYGKTRSGVQEIISHRPDANALTQRFEELDAEIGRAAAGIPSRTEGRSMMDDLGKQAAELLQRAVDAVKSAFTWQPSADASARAAPSPSMAP